MIEYYFDQTSILETFDESIEVLRSVVKKTEEKFATRYKDLRNYFDKHNQLNYPWILSNKDYIHLNAN